MNIQHSDIILVGGGIAGMTAAAAFGTAGFSVALVDPSLAKQSNDLRSTAFLQPARALLARAGLWDLFEPHAAPLKIMRIIDAGGPPDAAAVSADFDASEIGDGPFGWNLPNMAIRQAALARLAQLPNVTQYPDTRFARLTPRRVEARVALSDGTQLSAKLLIGADGRKSAVRKAAGIGTKIHRYGQKALVFTVRHAPPHNDCSTEVHLSGGPFTMVPLPDADDGHRSAIVWMETSAEAARLMQLDEAAFNDAASHRSAGVLGPLALTSPTFQKS
ncbi:MAG: hypothetical protein COA47_14275 [Robiginitomaculum sp.]|nr:MAG: hypothetical protein COA47_14275 [Robiginitomaculum sp.]